MIKKKHLSRKTNELQGKANDYTRKGTSKSWRKGEQQDKVTAIEAAYEEKQEAQAKLARLKKQVDKLLKEEGLEQWCWHSLEDLAEELAKIDRNKPISLANIRTWQLELATIKADNELEDDRTLLSKKMQ